MKSPTFRFFVLFLVLLSRPLAHAAALRCSSVDANREHITFSSFAQQTAVGASAFDSTYKLSLPHPVQDKNFYLLSLFQRNEDVRRRLARNPTLRRLALNKTRAWNRAARCSDPSCMNELLRFDGPTIDSVTNALNALAPTPAFKRLASEHLRPSGVFIKHNNFSDAGMLIAAWKDAANGINRILRVYGLGTNPFYKDIDRATVDLSTAENLDLLKSEVSEIRLSREPLFFEPTMSLALKLLEINRRDEAGRYEPLEEGENKAALQNLKNIRWNDYAYSHILVLGSGPGDTGKLSPIGAKRSDVAAQFFLQRKAPLLIFSGGHVHPIQTPYCEAIEMKKYVMDKYKIPESSILIEPFARHTTTNFRNAARLVFRYGIPTGRKGLVTSSDSHITVVTGNGFRVRCNTELGYSPIESIKRISPVEAEYTPSVTSLYFDANDPLDP